MSRLEEALKLLDELIDDEECQYDHHAYCQTHRLGQYPCVNERATRFIQRCYVNPVKPRNKQERTDAVI